MCTLTVPGTTKKAVLMTLSGVYGSVDSLLKPYNHWRYNQAHYRSVFDIQMKSDLQWCGWYVAIIRMPLVLLTQGFLDCGASHPGRGIEPLQRGAEWSGEIYEVELSQMNDFCRRKTRTSQCYCSEFISSLFFNFISETGQCNLSDEVFYNCSVNSFAICAFPTGENSMKRVYVKPSSTT